jgi:catechol 2,3-dioxygenase-like lactoylglutathione lyase family enzyme
MTQFSQVILYVTDAPASAAFYTQRLGLAKIFEMPTFVMFKLGDGVELGLWQKSEVHPKPVTAAGGSEVNFRLASDAEVDSLCKNWAAHGVEIIEQPRQLDFGYAFTALDPDGNRIRMFAPASRM